MIRNELGERIKILRAKNNISQEGFALLIGMNRTYLASVERGRRNISLDNLIKIANGFDITLEELFRGI